MERRASLETTPTGLSYRCRSCAAEFDATEWTELDLVRSLTPREVQRLVLHWPADMQIEVRACRDCRSDIVQRRHV